MLAKILLLALAATALARPHDDQINFDKTVSVSDKLCPSDQRHFLLPHEYDCAKFYYCEYGERWPTPRDCAPGTYFSFELQVCVHPAQANCDLPGVPPTEAEPTTTKAPEPTTTEAPEPTTTEAPAPTTTEAPEPTTTEAPEPTTTEAPEPTTTEAPEPTTTEAPEPTAAPTTSAPGGGVTAPEGTDWLDNGCPVSFDIHWLLPHADCSKFYYCNFGEKVERQCPPNTLFNPELQVCDWPENVNCELGGEKPTTTDAPESTITAAPASTTSEAPEPTTTEAPEPTTTEAPESTAASTTSAPGGGVTAPEGTEWLDNGCPADFDIHWLLPHESDCGKFYYCVRGEKYKRECPVPLHFNPKIQVCDWPENVGCELGGEEPTTTDASESTAAPTTSAPEGGEVTTPEGSDWLDNGCPADFDKHWLLPHESDCGKFYYCVLGEKFKRDCPVPLHFNPKIQVCDWPENVGCELGGEEPTTTETPVSTTTATPESATSEAPEPTTIEASESTTTEAPESTAAPTTSAPGGGVTATEDIDWLDNGCPADFDIHWLLPHESDCGKFYYCVRGEKVKRECPAPLHFNPEIQVCDWPENVGCELGGEEPTTTETPVSTTTATPESATSEAPEPTTIEASESTTTEAPESTAAPTTSAPGGGVTATEDIDWLDNGCPADFDIHWLLPHESDCGKFYYCVRGEKVKRECPAPLHFNPEIQVCDWPENVGCELGGEEPTTTETPVSTTTATPESATSEAPEPTTIEPSESTTTEAPKSTAAPTTSAPGGGVTATEDIDWLDNGCPADFDIHWLLPHESDCGKFYYCVRGEKVKRECPVPLHFNPEIQVCDWPENVGCGLGGAEPTTTEASESTTTEAPESTTTEAPEPTTTDAPEPTAAPTTSAPGGGVTTPKGTDWLDNGCPADFDVHWLLPHEDDCGKFYYCVFGEKVERECNDPLHFNPTLQVCDWPENAGCSVGGGDSEPTTTEAPEPTTTEAPEPTTTEAPEPTTTEAPEPTTTEAPEPTTTEAPEPTTTEASEPTAAPTTSAPEDGVTTPKGTDWLDNGCPADFDVHWLLPHEDDCGKFYYCVFGEKVERECPHPLHFNPTLQVCDWPENAGCSVGGGDSEPTTTEAPEPTTTEAPEPTTTEAPEPTTTEAPEPTTTEAPEPTTTEASEPTAAPTTSAPEDGVTTPKGTDWLDNGCPADFDVHWLLPHEDDCGKFYYCVFGEKVERECPHPLHFNPTLQVCDWPENAGCSVGGGDSEPTTTEAPEPTTTEAPEPTTTEAPEPTTTEAPEPTTTEAPEPTTTEAPEPTTTEASEPTAAPTTSAPEDGVTTPKDWLDNGCPADFDVHWLLPHEDDCGKFYYCVFGEKVERECNDPLHFNPTLQVCDWPENAGCSVGGGDSEPTTTEAPEPTTTEAPEPTTTEAPEPTTTEAPEPTTDHSKCEEQCNILPWAHETACDKYWSCEGNEAVLVICSEGLHFNAKTGTCDFICNANCVRESVQTTSDQQGLKVFIPWDKFSKGMRAIYN